MKLTANLEIHHNLDEVSTNFINSLFNVIDCINILFQIGKTDNLFQNSENYFYNKIIDILKDGTLNLNQSSKTEIVNQIKQIENGIYDMGSVSYKYSDGREVELIFGKVFSPENNNKKLYGGVLVTTDSKLRKTLNKFDDLTQKIYEEFKFRESKTFSELKSDFRCMDVISFSGELDRKEKPISVFYSGGSQDGISSLSKVAVFSNIYLYRFKLISAELGKKFIKDFRIPDDNLLKQMLVCWLRGHDVGHSFGKDNLGRKMKDNRKEYYILHELKSDILSLYILKKISNDLFEVDILNQLYLVFIAEMLRYIRRCQFYLLPDSGSAYLTYKHLYEFGVLKLDKTTYRIDIDFEKFNDFIETFSKKLISLFINGGKEDALNIVNKWSEIKNLESQRLPEELSFLNDNTVPHYLELITEIN